MTVNKRSKRSRHRGTRSHGWGRRKKHRGAGNRGGRGMAGSSRSKKFTILKEYGKDYFGKRGFVLPRKVKRVIKAINLQQIEEKINYYIGKGLAKKSNNLIEINLKDLGYNKLLGKGLIKNKYKIITEFVSKHAEEKVKNLGGEIILNKDVNNK